MDPRRTNILVLGGGGYIGSHVVKELLKRDYHPVTYDNFSTGHRRAILGGDVIEADLSDTRKLRDALETYNIDAVMHFAASAYVAESMQNPRKYFHNNVVNTLNLLDALVDVGTKYLIFSSSCAVYGIPKAVPINEDHPCDPVSPYGESKLVIERMLRWYCESYGLRYVSLRYFNAAGADSDGEIGEAHDPEPHLIPRVLQVALGLQNHVEIYGVDYPTPDGTCIRDFIHVTDLADAHICALEYLFNGGQSETFNLGAGVGHSVRGIVNFSRQITGRKLKAVELERRRGDPPVLVASGERVKRMLGWKAVHSSLEEILHSAWGWVMKVQAERSVAQVT